MNQISTGSEFRRKTRAAVLIAAFAAVFLLLIWFAADLVLLTFAAVLFAIFLRSMTQIIVRYTKLKDKYALGITTILLILLIAVSMASMANDIAKQVDELT